MVRLRDKYDLWLLGIIGIPVAIILFAIVFLVFEYAGSEVKIQRAKVVQVFYQARRSGVGVGTTSNGSSTTIIASSPASYSLMLEFDDGKRAIVKTNKASFVAVDEGKEYKFYCHYGHITEELLGCER